jgi:hypothetical protein
LGCLAQPKGTEFRVKKLITRLKSGNLLRKQESNPIAVNAQNAGRPALQSKRGYIALFVIVPVILFTAGVRIRLLEVPLERDEGEYAYAGQLMLEGVAPYGSVYNMKLPGVYAAYAVILGTFGQTDRGIHLGLIFINAATAVLVFLVARKLFGLFVGAGAAAAFCLLSLNPWVGGIEANAEHFVILPAIGGILLLLGVQEKGKWWVLVFAAVLLGICFLMKQHGAAFVVFGGLYLLGCEFYRRPRDWRLSAAKAGVYLTCATIPFAVTCIALWRAGVFEKFWFWTFDYAREYVTRQPISMSFRILSTTIPSIIGPSILLWLTAGVGLGVLILKDKDAHRRLFVEGFLLFSILAVCPGFYFRQHYFILLLPAAAVLAGIGGKGVLEFLERKLPSAGATALFAFLALAAVLEPVYKQRNFFFALSPSRVAREVYGSNPFPEAFEIGKFIKANSEVNDRIAVIGSEPQIYFYSNRRSATGYIYTYPLMKNNKLALRMQQEMISEIESVNPEYLVFVRSETSWLPKKTSNKLIFEWFEQYKQRYYQPAGFVDVVSPEETIYRWGKECEKYRCRSETWLGVFRRKS